MLFQHDTKVGIILQISEKKRTNVPFFKILLINTRNILIFLNILKYSSVKRFHRGTQIWGFSYHILDLPNLKHKQTKNQKQTPNFFNNGQETFPPIYLNQEINEEKNTDSYQAVKHHNQLIRKTMLEASKLKKEGRQKFAKEKAEGTELYYTLKSSQHKTDFSTLSKSFLSVFYVTQLLLIQLTF